MRLLLGNNSKKMCKIRSETRKIQKVIQNAFLDKVTNDTRISFFLSVTSEACIVKGLTIRSRNVTSVAIARIVSADVGNPNTSINERRKKYAMAANEPPIANPIRNFSLLEIPFHSSVPRAVRERKT